MELNNEKLMIDIKYNLECDLKEPCLYNERTVEFCESFGIDPKPYPRQILMDRMRQLCRIVYPIFRDRSKKSMFFNRKMKPFLQSLSFYHEEPYEKLSCTYRIEYDNSLDLFEIGCYNEKENIGGKIKIINFTEDDMNLILDNWK